MQSKSASVLLLLIFCFLPAILQAQPAKQVEVCVYGGTSAGVIAAYTAKKAGKTVLLIEPGKHLGGLSSGGLGYTDIGNKYAVSGLALDFYRRIGAHYGKLEQWIFEPHVAENTFVDYIRKGNVEVLYQHRLISVKTENTSIREIIVEKATSPCASSH